MFYSNEGNFYKNAKEKTEFTRETPCIEKFVDFWAAIWEDDTQTPNTQWMHKIKNKLQEKINFTDELEVKMKE